MRKKITLTSYRNTPIDFSVDEIESIDIVDDVTFITTKGNVAYFVKESKSRVLRMIETAKQGGFLLGERMEKEQAEHELAELHEKERSLEKALELVREKIRELVNYTNKNKGQK